MDSIGTKRKSRKEQARDAELGLIIDEFGRTMWNADRSYIAERHQDAPSINFTLAMKAAWQKYVEFCRSHLE